MAGLSAAGLPAPARGVFTSRAGGTSTGPYAGLDLALHVGDEPGAVAANRALLAADLDGASLVFAEQVHGREVAVVTEPADAARPGVDALVTTVPGVALVVLAADCLPVLLADPVAGVVGAVHAGRQGLVAGVLQAALVAMRELGARPEAITAVLGPAACGQCYEVPAAMAEEVERHVPGSRGTTRQGTPSVDLTAGATGLLRAAGLAQVRTAGGCAFEQQQLYSYRRDGRTGRHAGVVVLRP